MSKKSKCDCERGGSFPLFGNGFTRRHFLQVAGTGIVASYFADVASARLLSDVTAVNPTLHNTARNCILIFLSGAPSHVDTWDLKEGAWTPAADFNPTQYGDMRFPQGLMPKTAEQLGKLAIIRSGLSWAAVHSLAQTWAQIARNPAGATGRIAPHIGAVVSLESQKSRRDTGSTPLVGSSSNRISGRCSSVHISASFCFMPPESLPACRSRNGSMRVIFKSRPVRSSRSAPVTPNRSA